MGHNKNIGVSHKVAGSILLATCAHPDGIIRELSRRSLLDGLESIVSRRPPDKRVRGHGSRGEANCASSDD